MKRQALAQATAVLPQAEAIWLDSVHDAPLMRPAELVAEFTQTLDWPRRRR